QFCKRMACLRGKREKTSTATKKLGRVNPMSWYRSRFHRRGFQLGNELLEVVSQPQRFNIGVFLQMINSLRLLEEASIPGAAKQGESPARISLTPPRVLLQGRRGQRIDAGGIVQDASRRLGILRRRFGVGHGLIDVAGSQPTPGTGQLRLGPGR